jgi:hypothetical protein
MPESFAIAVQWPDDSRPYLVHLKKPYFVAEVRRIEGAILFVTTLDTKQWRQSGDEIAELLPRASRFFAGALGIEDQPSHFLKGSHGREFPRFLMAKTLGGTTFIVEPDHPSPLVEVKEPKNADGVTALAKHAASRALSGRFDTVTQYRLGQMRKYYQQFVERQNGRSAAQLVIPHLAATPGTR